MILGDAWLFVVTIWLSYFCIILLPTWVLYNAKKMGNRRFCAILRTFVNTIALFKFLNERAYAHALRANMIAKGIA